MISSPLCWNSHGSIVCTFLLRRNLLNCAYMRSILCFNPRYASTNQQVRKLLEKETRKKSVAKPKSMKNNVNHAKLDGDIQKSILLIKECSASEFVHAAHHHEILLKSLSSLCGFDPMTKKMLRFSKAQKAKPFENLINGVSPLLINYMTIRGHERKKQSSDKKLLGRKLETLRPSFLLFMIANTEHLKANTLGSLTMILLQRMNTVPLSEVHMFIEKSAQKMLKKISKTEPRKLDKYDEFLSDISNSFTTVPRGESQCEANTVVSAAKTLILMCSSNEMALKYANMAHKLFEPILSAVPSMNFDDSQNIIVSTALLTYARTFRTREGHLLKLAANQDTLPLLIGRIPAHLRQKPADPYDSVIRLILSPMLYRSLCCVSLHRAFYFLKFDSATIDAIRHDAVMKIPEYNKVGLAHMMKTAWFGSNDSGRALLVALSEEIHRFDTDLLTHFFFLIRRVKPDGIPNGQKLFEKADKLKDSVPDNRLLEFTSVLLSLQSTPQTTIDHCVQKVKQVEYSVEDIVRFLMSSPHNSKQSIDFQEYFVQHLLATIVDLQTFLKTNTGKRLRYVFVWWLKNSKIQQCAEILQAVNKS